ncbi:hypothetical protein L9F63_016430 [Diploptera punctata]|uniref:RING-type E3 ubiquitin transferase n=1 Tax=Diploptera punctata TaxID=6984 RepID=A0AAD8A334_DIPPU|nr:hypothetical protein L9F63_016430 [Diploptera punctata]
MTVPGFLCKKGHNACFRCKHSRTACKICGNTYVFSVVIKNMPSKKCAFSELGCEKQLALYAIKQHETSCEFRHMECPLKNTRKSCAWKGDLIELKSHIQLRHDVEKDFKYIEVENVLVRDNITGILEFKNNIYVLNIHIYQNTFYSYIQLVGQSIDARNTKCRIKITKNSMEKIMFQTKIWSYATNKREILNSGDCARIPFKILKNYLVNEKDLHISLKLYGVFDESINKHL